MQIAISLTDHNGLDSKVSTVFGRCPYFMFVKSESKDFTIKPNAAQAFSGGAGIQAAQMVVDNGAEAVISGNLGPNAQSVLAAANIPVYQFGGGSVRQALEDFSQNKLPVLSSPSAPAHSG